MRFDGNIVDGGIRGKRAKGSAEAVGWVELFAKPIIFAGTTLRD
jgi:hypothetical protein